MNPKKSTLYTKTGDLGLTSLYNGTRESKTSQYFSCLGDIDELNCNLGMVKAFYNSEINKSEIKYYNPPGAGGLIYKTEKCMDSGKYYEWFALNEYITEIQCNLMDISSLIATPPNNITLDEDIQLWYSRISIHKDIINGIEKNIDRLDSLLPKITNFVLPYGNPLLCQIHICRAISRRCERSYLLINQNNQNNQNNTNNQTINDQFNIARIYLNRLSDYLFALSRFVGMTLDIKEDLYSKKK